MSRWPIDKACVLVRRTVTGTDRYGSPTRGEVEVETYCHYEQSDRDEPERAGEVSETTWDFYLPPDDDALALSTADAIEVDGKRYEIIGDPWTVEGRNGPDHVEVTARRAETGDEDEGS